MKNSVKKKIKNIKSQSTETNHLKPIDDILYYIEMSEVKLRNLLDAIPAKLEKLVLGAKKEIDKLTVKHKKTNVTLKSHQAKHKAKPSKLTQVAVKHAEQERSAISKLIGSAKSKHDSLKMQLATCKEMKKHLTAVNKLNPSKSKIKTKASKFTKKQKKNLKIL